MAFLAPIAAKVAPFLIGALKNKGVQNALGTIGSSILGSKLSGGAGGVERPNDVLKGQMDSIEHGRALSSSLEPSAQNLLSMASSSYSPVANYYGGLLSGNRGAAMSAMSPEVQRINEGYSNTRQDASTLMPRGGGRSSFLSQLPYQRTRDVTNLLTSARPGAAQGLLQTGQTAANTSQGLFATILNAMQGANSGTSNLLNYDLQSRRDQYTKGKDTGRGIFDILQGLKGGFGKGGAVGGGGSSGSPIWSTGE